MPCGFLLLLHILSISNYRAKNKIDCIKHSWERATNLQKVRHNSFQLWVLVCSVPGLLLLHSVPAVDPSTAIASLYDQLLQSGSGIGAD